MDKHLVKVIIDDESGEKFPITKDKVDRATLFIKKIEYNLLDICVNLKTIIDEKLYLYVERPDGEIGYTNFWDFTVDRLRWSPRTAERYLSIAKSFLAAPAEKRDKILSLPFNAAYELAQLPEDVKQHMIDTGFITLANGEDVSVDELIAIRSKDLISELKSLKKQHRALSSTLTQQKERTNKEIDQLKRENDTYRRAIDSLDVDPEALKLYQGIRDTNEALLLAHEAQGSFHAGFTKLKCIEIKDVEIAKAIKGVVTYLREMCLELEQSIDEVM